jgi:glycine/D-amino acid oxidase-like deaminating enzyme
VDIADADLPGASSLPAAGIINPVTGKRFVKSWRFDTFFPAARAMYADMEATLGLSVWREQPILRLLASAEEQNDWAARCALPEYAAELGEATDAGPWQAFLPPGMGIGLIRRAARVDFSRLLPALRAHAQREGFFKTEKMDHAAALRLLPEVDALVFCEGYRAADNPFFPGLPWQIAKGEALLLRIPGATGIRAMLKKTMTLVPLHDDLFWAGGSYQWHYPDLLPSAGERAYILQHVRQMLRKPFEVQGHVAGVRPTVKDRRPFLGASPTQDKVFIFNGLGTKGALLAPYWAEHLAQHLLHKTALDPELGLQRGIRPA